MNHPIELSKFVTLLICNFCVFREILLRWSDEVRRDGLTCRAHERKERLSVLVGKSEEKKHLKGQSIDGS
jgi:hypothetical protein